MSISDEFSFINKITPKSTFQPSLVKGIGDDAALFRGCEQFDEVICMDTMVEGVHFTLQTMSPYHIGYKAVAVNISDVAAMGGYPVFYLVSIAAPKSWSERMLMELYEGMAAASVPFKMDLIGGDTVSSDNLLVTVTVIGRVERGKQLLRSNVKQGDVIFVTGTVGDSSAGLDLLLQYSRDHEYTCTENFLVKRHQMPQPRVEEGRLLSTFERVALNDVSDGIASESHELAEASNVSIILQVNDFPRSKELVQYSEEQQLRWMLNGGEDFELIGAASKQEWHLIKKIFDEKGLPISKIGFAESGPSCVFLQQNGEREKLEKSGFNHFNRETGE